MRLPDQLAQGSVFLTVEDGGQFIAAGTAFFLGTKEPYCLYLVTARHCVRKAERYRRLGIGLNTKDGRKAALWIPTESEWFYPESDADDIAVLPVHLNDVVGDYEILPYFIDTFALTREKAEKHGVGVGDEIAIVGLFTQSTGKNRLRPIVRSGIIAATPDESLEDYESGLPYFAYLIEVRSIGGLSGSPVFLILPPGRFHNSEMQPEIRVIYLLGVVRGHFTKDLQEYAEFIKEEAAQLNTGIAVVTPIQVAVDVIMNNEELKKQRAEQAKLQADWKV